MAQSVSGDRKARMRIGVSFGLFCLIMRKKRRPQDPERDSLNIVIAEGDIMKTSAKRRTRLIMVPFMILSSCAVFLISPAEASLNLQLGIPDVASFYITTAYNAGTQAFTSTGYATTVTMDGVSQPYITNSDGSDFLANSFNISAVITNNGVATSGLLQMNGYVVQQGFNTDVPVRVNQPFTSGTLLTGNLVNFDYLKMDRTYAMFEFIFQVTGGDLMPYFGDRPAGVILSLGDFGNYATNPLFASDFNMNSGNMVSDTGPVVPIPGAVWLLGSGLIGLVGLRRKLKK